MLAVPALARVAEPLIPGRALEVSSCTAAGSMGRSPGHDNASSLTLVSWAAPLEAAQGPAPGAAAASFPWWWSPRCRPGWCKAEPGNL